MTLTAQHLAAYDDLGFIQSVPILTPEEVGLYRGAIERTSDAFGGITRLDAPHLFFRWAWDLVTHPRMLAAMSQLLGPDLFVKSTRLFYKPGRTQAFVGWHQDGITERIEDARVPAVWLGLTDATVENGCLRVVPRSHRLGLIPHADRPHEDNLTTQGVTAQTEIGEAYDVVMRAGEMSLHHPLLLHASNPNRSAEPRIGYTITYCTPSLRESRTPLVRVAGEGAGQEPPPQSLDEAIATYKERHGQVRFARAAGY